MNKTIYLVLLILVTTSVLATDVEIDQVKFYVNDERYSGPDKDGGEIRVHRGDTFDMIIRLKNNIENTTRAKIYTYLYSIDDGDDMEKSLDWFDIDGDDDKSKTISYIVPDTAVFDSYELEVEVFYDDWNDTEHKLQVDYEVYVRKIVEEEKVFNLQEGFYNMTNMYEEMLGSMDRCFTFIGMSHNYSAEVSTFKEKYGKCDTELNNTVEQCNKDKDSQTVVLDECEVKLSEKDQEIRNLKSERDRNYITRQMCSNQTQRQIQDAKKPTTNLLWIGGAIALVVVFVKKRSKSKRSASDHEYLNKPI